MTGLHEMDRSVRTATHRRRTSGPPEEGGVEAFLSGIAYVTMDLLPKLKAGDEEAWAYLLGPFAHAYGAAFLRSLTGLSPFKGHAVVCVHQPGDGVFERLEMIGDAHAFHEALLAGRKPKAYAYSAFHTFHGGQIMAISAKPARKSARPAGATKTSTP
jgi:hypothetical protein